MARYIYIDDTGLVLRWINTDMFGYGEWLDTQLKIPNNPNLIPIETLDWFKYSKRFFDSSLRNLVDAVYYDGKVIDYIPPEPMDSAALRKAVNARLERDVRLGVLDCAINQAIDTGASEDVILALRAKRQALRDIPQQPGFPDEIIWPE